MLVKIINAQGEVQSYPTHTSQVAGHKMSCLTSMVNSLNVHRKSEVKS